MNRRSIFRRFLAIMVLGALSLCLLHCAASPEPEKPKFPEAAKDAAMYDEQRERMVRQDIKGRSWGHAKIDDPAVIRAMGTVPRHLFVPERQRSSAYADHPLPIGAGQTISQPFIVAAMTQLAQVKKGDRVLEIGTGSGYQAAVLAEIVKKVYTIEIVPELGNRAKALLKELEYNNVHVKIGDGYKGWPEHAPFDAIIVTAAPAEIPQPLIDQLKPGGHMVIPVGPASYAQELRVVTKDLDGTLHQHTEMAVRFVPFTREKKDG